ncbi:hypothetical protein GCM10010236_57560 [Streptomyces eurythermus]|nr:hypothetical protein GCM10010236_57560 [Streptomyces eurythermus]
MVVELLERETLTRRDEGEETDHAWAPCWWGRERNAAPCLWNVVRAFLAEGSRAGAGRHRAGGTGGTRRLHRPWVLKELLTWGSGVRPTMDSAVR